MDKPTIRDVAEEADVSIATVSRVINNAENVNSEMRERVIQAISKLNYRPNRIAQGLKNKSTNTIGVIVSNIANPFFMDISKQIENIVKESNYTLIMGSSEDEAEKELNYIELLHEKQVDGLIISSTGKNEDYLYQLYNSGLPMVFIDRRPTEEKLDTVYVDKNKSTYEMVEYLINRGHKRIALITGPKDIVTNFDRYVGYTKAFFDYDIKLEHKYILFRDFTVDFGREALQELFSMDEPPTAVISGSSLITEGILIQARRMDLDIPGDFSLITFGNIDMSELVEPKMTYSDQMSYQIGEEAGRLLLKRMKDFKKNTEEIVLNTEICEGDSVKSLV